MPIFIQWVYTDGSIELEKEHEYVWRKNELEFVKTYYKKKKVKAIILDPYRETADIDETNNTWNCVQNPQPYEIYHDIQQDKRFNQEEFNPMKFFEKK